MYSLPEKSITDFHGYELINDFDSRYILTVMREKPLILGEQDEDTREMIKDLTIKGFASISGFGLVHISLLGLQALRANPCRQTEV